MIYLKGASVFYDYLLLLLLRVPSFCFSNIPYTTLNPKSMKFSAKQVPTMMPSQLSWRKSPRQKKGIVICTRLIFQAAIGAVKKYAIRRGSERTICSCKCPNRTVSEGHDRPCLQIQHMPLPGRHTILMCLPNSMMVAVPTPPRQS